MKKQGFTLIEILVVTTLIGLLTVIGVTSYTNLNRQARDVKRKGNLDQIRSAIELFRSNHPNNSYPDDSVVNLSSCTPGNITDPVDGSVYLSKIPQDPFCQSRNYKYYYHAVDSAGGACNSSPGTASPCTDYTVAAVSEGNSNLCVAAQCGATGCTYCLGPLGEK